MKGYIVQRTYRVIDGKALVLLFGRLSNGQSFLATIETKPYFYIKTADEKKTSTEPIKFELEKTKLVDFTGKKVSKVIFDNPRDAPDLRKEFETAGIKCYEADIRLANRYLFDNEIKGSIEIEGEYESSEIIDRIYKNPGLESSDWKPELKILSFDIETNSDASMIYAVSLVTHGIKDESKVLIFSKEKIKNVECFESEQNLLLAFQNEIIRQDPDIITGWNVINFDLDVIKKRFKYYGLPLIIGRDNSECKVTIEKDYFKSSSVEITGRVVIDAIDMLKKSFIKLTNYKLDTAAVKFLGEQKLITFKDKQKEIEELYENNKLLLAEYCLKDSQLVIEILKKSKVLELTILRSLLTGMPLDRVSASIASLDSLYLLEARKRGLVLPSGSYQEKTENIKGGYVMDSVPGIYSYIVVLDFKSLYPSIIRTFNIDPASYVPDCKGKNLVKAPNGACFRNEEGILPMIIERLWKQRDIAKKNEDELTSYAVKILMNSFFGALASPACRFFSLEMANAITHFSQHIIKLTSTKIQESGYEVIYSDSVDGKTKVILKEKGKVFEENIENIFIKVNKNQRGKEYNFKSGIKVLTLDNKGNSVYMPVNYVMRHKCNKKMYRINFTNNWHIDVTEDHSLMGYQSLAFNNSKKNRENPLNRIIQLKPEEIRKKANTIVSLKKIPHKYSNGNNYSKEVYEFMGYFIGDGSFQRNKAHQRNNKDYYLHISSGSDQKEVIKKIITPLKKQGLIKNYWLSKTRKGDLTINGLEFAKLIAKHFKYNHKKTIPNWLFEEKEENIASFLRGLFSADGCVMIRSNAPIIKYTSIEDKYINNVRKLLYRVGVSHSVFKENSVNRYKTKNKIYSSGSYSKNIIIQDKDTFREKIGFIFNRKNKLANIKTDGLKKRHIKHFEFDIQAVKTIEEIKTPKYVYDIEVKNNHKFFANYVLVHNTDSCFVNTKAKSTEEANEIGNKLQSEINEFYKKHIKEEHKRNSCLELELKKCYSRFMMPKLRNSEIGAKKRYAGIVAGKDKLEIVGMEAIRVDWTDLAKDFQKELLTAVFHDKDPSRIVIDYVKDLRSGKLDNKLIYRKSIRKGLKEYVKSSPPHVKAARLLENLDSSIIEYVITTNGPEPIQLIKHPVDYEHYLDKQLKPIADAILMFFNLKFETISGETKQSKLSGF